MLKVYLAVLLVRFADLGIKAVLLARTFLAAAVDAAPPRIVRGRAGHWGCICLAQIALLVTVRLCLLETVLEPLRLLAPVLIVRSLKSSVGTQFWR